jgi:hypothetical protein
LISRYTIKDKAIRGQRHCIAGSRNVGGITAIQQVNRRLRYGDAGSNQVDSDGLLTVLKVENREFFSWILQDKG